MIDRLRYVLVGLLLALAVVIWAGTPIFAQDEGDPPAPDAPVGLVDLRSPRGALNSFMHAHNDARDRDRPERMRDALRCLELSPQERSAPSAVEIADKLKDVLDRHGKIKVEGLPGPAQAAALDGFWALDTAGGRVLLRVVGEEWLVSRSTLDRLDAMLARFEDAGTTADDSYDPLWLRKRMPEALKSRALFLEHWQWLGLVVLALLSWIVGKMTGFITRQLVGGALRRRKWLANAADAADAASRPVGLFAVALLFFLGAPSLDLPTDPDLRNVVGRITPKLFASLGLVVILYRLCDVVTGRMRDAAASTESKLDDQLVPLIGKSMKIVVTVAGLLFILDNLEADIWSLLTGLGVASLAVALAAKDTFANLFGSITVFMDKPFQVGDWVIVSGVEGTVEEVGFRSTRVRTFYNSLVSVPNAKLVDSAIDNMGMRVYRRFKTTVGVQYDTPPEKIEAFCAGMRAIVEASPDTRKDVHEIYLNDWGASSLNILVYIFFKVPNWDAELRARQNFMVEVIRLAGELGVEFAFPTQTLHLASTPERPLEAHEAKRVDELDAVMRRFGKDGDLARPEGTPTWSTAKGPTR